MILPNLLCTMAYCFTFMVSHPGVDGTTASEKRMFGFDTQVDCETSAEGVRNSISSPTSKVATSKVPSTITDVTSCTPGASHGDQGQGQRQGQGRIKKR